ncbi:hypothetical protein [Sorangium sp. So ce1389]|uniref:hypothetical protein n=1 Tax=Sorangium sp. So ce1389 TaxID=3133336 RepID=UPI003F625AF1
MDATNQGDQAALWWILLVNGRELKRVRVGENMRKGVSMMVVWQLVTPERFSWLPGWLRRPLVFRLMDWIESRADGHPRADGVTIERYLAGEPRVSLSLSTELSSVGYVPGYGDVIQIRVVRERNHARIG